MAKIYHSDKHFSGFLRTRWWPKSAGVYMEQNYALSPYVYPAVVTVECAIPHGECRRGEDAENARHENASNAIVWNTECCICLLPSRNACVDKKEHQISPPTVFL